MQVLQLYITKMSTLMKDFSRLLQHVHLSSWCSSELIVRFSVNQIVLCIGHIVV